LGIGSRHCGERSLEISPRYQVSVVPFLYFLQLLFRLRPLRLSLLNFRLRRFDRRFDFSQSLRQFRGLKGRDDRTAAYPIAGFVVYLAHLSRHTSVHIYFIGRVKFPF
jgi:hypothetical protein